jgi:hypothetical protein
MIGANRLRADIGDLPSILLLGDDSTIRQIGPIGGGCRGWRTTFSGKASKHRAMTRAAVS